MPTKPPLAKRTPANDVTALVLKNAGHSNQLISERTRYGPKRLREVFEEYTGDPDGEGQVNVRSLFRVVREQALFALKLRGPMNLVDLAAVLQFPEGASGVVAIKEVLDYPWFKLEGGRMTLTALAYTAYQVAIRDCGAGI